MGIFNKNFKVNTGAQVFDIRKGTKKAVTVLQDLFGNSQQNLTDDGIIISPKKKLYCLILAIFFGLGGVHRLYLGDFRHFIMHVGTSSFVYAAYYWLPDNGLTLLVAASLILWVIADILAIFFSRIKDAKNRVVANWY